MSLWKFIDPRYEKWWEMDEWAEINSYLVEETVEEYENSWDVRPAFVYEHVNKNNLETRFRRYPYPRGEDCTTFTNPLESGKSTWDMPVKGEVDLGRIEEFNLYEGPDYEKVS